MKVLDLLEDIEEIVDTSSGVPLTGKIIVESEELLEIVRDIRTSLPEEIHQAQWIKSEQQRILTEAKTEYNKVLQDAKKQAEILVNNDDITIKAKIKAEEILDIAEEKSRQLKLGAYEYVDSILYDFQEKMEQLNAAYFIDMFSSLENTFNDVNNTLESNRSDIRNMAMEVKAEQQEKGTVSPAPSPMETMYEEPQEGSNTMPPDFDD